MLCTYMITWNQRFNYAEIPSLSTNLFHLLILIECKESVLQDELNLTQFVLYICGMRLIYSVLMKRH